jgi:hypothetical protein
VTAQPTAAEAMAEAGLSGDTMQRVMAGEFVTEELDPSADRDLSIAIAFFIKKASPDEIRKEIMAGDLITADAQVQAHGEITGDGSLTDFASLPMNSDTAKLYADAEADSALNLSTGEIAAFKALRDRTPQAVQKQLQAMLLARVQSYRSSGLGGIPTYDRGGSTADPAADLRRATVAAKGLKKYLPSLQDALMDYPKGVTPKMSQNFFWATYDQSGKANYVLTHVIAAPDGDARAIVQRQYYASTGYNAEQAVAAFLPVQEGTIVLYSNHTFTEQVSGFGGSMKRKIGRSMMTTQLEKVFSKDRQILSK